MTAIFCEALLSHKNFILSWCCLEVCDQHLDWLNWLDAIVFGNVYAPVCRGWAGDHVTPVWWWRTGQEKLHIDKASRLAKWWFCQTADSYKNMACHFIGNVGLLLSSQLSWEGEDCEVLVNFHERSTATKFVYNLRRTAGWWKRSYHRAAPPLQV